MINRREFLQTGISASSLLLKAATPKSVVIAGGGIAGLCCAYELMSLGHDVTVLEASDRAGGHVKTVRADLPDGMYVDAGAEHFTKPGYDLYWSYVEKFKLPHMQDHRRENILRLVGGKMRTEQDLANPQVLATFGLNQREIDYLKSHPWWDLASLYLDKYAERIKDEYKPLDAGLNDLDHLSRGEFFKREGASEGFIRMQGGDGSALQAVWHQGILRKRGVPPFPTQVFRLIGGNSKLPEKFAELLGERVKLNSPLRAIEHGKTGVTVKYGTAGGATKTLEAGHLVCCMSAVMLRRIPVTPAFDERKRWAIANVPYYSATRPILVTRSKFWKEQKMTVNVQFNEPAFEHCWSMADDVATERGLIVGTAQPGVKAEAALATFRKYYPGKTDQIERALIVDWSRDPWCLACETTSYRPGELSKFWPAIIEPSWRIHFAGAYCDNLNWGQEAATRSANRVAREIHAA